MRSARSICPWPAWYGRNARPGVFNCSPRGRHPTPASDRPQVRRAAAYLLAGQRAARGCAGRRAHLCLKQASLWVPDPVSTPELFLVYSDGSGVESYRCDHGVARWGGKQLASGDVVFTHGYSLARFTSPLAHEAPVAAPRAEYAGAIAETASGAWLLSARASGRRALRAQAVEAGRHRPRCKRCWPERQGSRRAGSGCAALEAQASSLRAARLELRQLLALDARLSREGDLKVTPASVRLEMLDAQGHAVVTGTAPVEADGSFLCEDPGRQADSLCVAGCKGRGCAPGARMVLDSPRRAAHLRRLPHGTGARIGESRAGRAAAHDNAGRSVRRECDERGAAASRREAIEMNYRFLFLFGAVSVAAAQTAPPPPATSAPQARCTAGDTGTRRSAAGARHSL